MMFIYTARLPKKRLIAGGVSLLCCVVAAATALVLNAGNQAVSTLAEVKGIRDNEDRVAYLEQLGWAVLPEPIAVEELLIPAEFDETYADYLALQEEQGFDLTRYRGKRVKRCTYEITNHPSGESGVQVSLLICKSTVIGGEVLSPVQNGILHGLEFPAHDTASPPLQSALLPEDGAVV